MTGILSYAQGLAGEAQVEAAYAARGSRIVARRWRGSCGEVDLVIQDGACLVFVEVKTSRSIGRALKSLRPAQINRITATAAEFLDTRPAGQLTETRFDVAAVTTMGQVEIVENALSV
ncbi:MAG: YraN family protein [Pseudomonadota bacterium]